MAMPLLPVSSTRCPLGSRIFAIDPVELLIEPDWRVIVLAFFGGPVRRSGFLHDGSRGNSPAGSATCSSMPASIALM
jgi:hypothetical protein